MNRKLSVAERMAIIKELATSIRKIKKIMWLFKTLLKGETDHRYPRVVDANKRNPDNWQS